MSFRNAFNTPASVLHTRTRSALKQFEAGDEPEPSNKVESFVKVLSGDFSQKLQIPEEFARNFDGQVPHRFIIESAATNKCWRVKVENDEDGSVYFGDGWYDFAVEHSLEIGDILVFECQEQSIFQVKVYGRSGCLKKALKEKRKGHAFERSNENEEEIEIDTVKYEHEISKNQCREKTISSPPNIYDNSMYKKKNAADRTCIRTAKVSITGKSVRFSITLHMKKTYQFSQLTIPTVISNEKKLRSKEKVLLENVKGKRWPVKLSHKRAGMDVLTYGWKDFVRDNELAAGDTLNFEFITDDLLRVDVARASPVGNHFEAKCQNEASESRSLNGAFCEPVVLTANNKLIEASTVETNASSGLNNSFSIMWRTTTARDYLYIPKAVVESQNLKDKESVVVRDPDGKCWVLQVRTWSNGQTALFKGWSDFWKAHGFTPGDSLNFEFISECFLQVTINRAKPPDNVIEGAETENPIAVTNSIKIDTEESEPIDGICHANLSSDNN